MKNLNTYLLLILIVVGAFLRFYNLNWGAPFYFHPDERNIASAVSQLQFPNQLHPHFFAYGSLPLYLFYFTALLFNLVSACKTVSAHCMVSFEEAIIVSRLYAAFFSTLLIPLIFVIGRELKNKEVGMLGAFLAATSVGFIQFAHFGTVETILAFLTSLLFYCCIRFYKTRRLFFFIASGILVGLLIATKVSSSILSFSLPLTLFMTVYHHASHGKRSSFFLTFLKTTGQLFFTFFLAGIVYVLTNPYVLLDIKGFIDSMRYESGVVLGTIPVFYTGEFYGTVPLLYPLMHSYPFLINPLLLILFLPSLLFFLIYTVKEHRFNEQLLLLFLLILFFSQSLFFAKWTRYLLPTLPFIYLLLSLIFVRVTQHMKRYVLFFSLLLIALCSLFAVSYVVTAFAEEDTRIAAAVWAKNSLDHDAAILSEMYDMGIVPFNDAFHHIELFNFYDLDTPSPDFTPETLQKQLAKSSYIILPSQRILKIRMNNGKKFPKGHDFYEKLTSEKNEFIKVYQTPCDMWCEITYLGDPVFTYEETVSVFDRPVVFIFKKNE